MPDTGYEIIEGKVFEVPPAYEPHANKNSKVAALLEAHVTNEFDVAVDMLTRASRISDFAPDASVYPVARDPDTGGRQLEHLAFEVVSSETLAHAGSKAALLRKRGVRRVFALAVEEQEVHEWSLRKKVWRRLQAGSLISDLCFVVPLPVDALTGAAKADDPVAAALLAKKNSILIAAMQCAETRGKTEGLTEGLREGKLAGLREGTAAGLREAIEAVCEVLGLTLDRAKRRRLAELEPEALDDLLRALRRDRTWPR